MTNYEYIKQMSKKQMALWLTMIAIGFRETSDAEECVLIYKDYINFLSQEKESDDERT